MSLRTQEDIFERLCMMLEDNRQDPLGFRRESLLEFTTHETLMRIHTKYPEKIPNIPGPDGWEPLDIEERYIHIRIHDRINVENKRDKKSDKPDILDLNAAHRIEAYVWLLGDEEALAMFENPRVFIGKPMLEYFTERYTLIEA